MTNRIDRFRYFRGQGGTHPRKDDVLDVAHAICLMDALLHLCIGDGHNLNGKHTQRSASESRVEGDATSHEGCNAKCVSLQVIIVIVTAVQQAAWGDISKRRQHANSLVLCRIDGA